MIKLLLTMENKGPSTVYDPYLVNCRDKLFQAYHEARRSLVPDYSTEPKEESYDATPNPYEADPYDQTLFYMANARAYFHGLHPPLHLSVDCLTYFPVTFRRFIHMVPMVIDQELLRGFDLDRGLDTILRKGLGITGRGSLEKAMKYLQDPPDVKRRRESLQEKRSRLLSAKRELQSI